MVKQVRPDVSATALPDLLDDAPAVVLLVDTSSQDVVAGNKAASALATGVRLPASLEEWSRAAGIRDTWGRIAAAAGGETVGGGVVVLEPGAGSAASSAGTWWVTGIPLAPRADGAPMSIVTLVEAPRHVDHAIDTDPARERLALLADVAEAAAELDSPLALQRVADVVAPRLVPWCAFVVVDGHLRVSASAGDIRRPGAEPFSMSLQERTGPEDVVAAQAAGEMRRPVDVSAVGRLPEGTAGRWLGDRLAGARPARAVSVPVPGRRGVLGLLVVGVPGGGLASEDAELLTEIARRVGLSVENSRLYAREHQLAETLQRSMLPEQAGVPGLDVWSYYAPNLDHAQVGGDWYDVLQLGPDSVALVVGDVVGHDVEAAASMGQLRSVVRAYATEEEDPGQVLMRVDQLVRGMRIPRSASMVLARLVRDGDSWDLEWSRAGHLPPLLLSGGEVHVLSDGGGTLVGGSDRPRTAGYRRIGPGDVLLLYTDGLIERRSRPLMDGLQLLREVTGNLLESEAAGIGEQLLTALGEEPEDDLAVVVLRVPTARTVEAPGTPRQRRWQLPGDPASIGHARRLTVASCTAWGLSCAPQAELVVSELVANAVLHGWGPVGLRLRHTARGLVVEVDDGNPTPPTVVEADQRGIGGYGIHVVERLAEWGWRRAGPGKTVWARVPETRTVR